MNKKTKFSTHVADKWRRLDTLKSAPLAAFPKTLMLEVTNACNLACIMCAHPKMTRKAGLMPVQLGTRVIAEAAQLGAQEVALYSTGEPLIHKQLEEFICAAHKHGLRSYITSNGLLLNMETAQMLCNSALDSFKFSIDAANKESYEKVRVNGNFDQLLEKVKLLKSVRDATASPMKIICACLKFSDSADEQQKQKDFEALFSPWCDSIFFSEVTNLGGKIKTSDSPTLTHNKPACRLLWDKLIVTYDGKLSACCIDFNAELIYADLAQESMESSWNNSLMQQWRQFHLEQKTTQMPMCGTCNTPVIHTPANLDQVNRM